MPPRPPPIIPPRPWFCMPPRPPWKPPLAPMKPPFPIIPIPCMPCIAIGMPMPIAAMPMFIGIGIGCIMFVFIATPPRPIVIVLVTPPRKFPPPPPRPGLVGLLGWRWSRTGGSAIGRYYRQQWRDEYYLTFGKCPEGISLLWIGLRDACLSSLKFASIIQLLSKIYTQCLSLTYCQTSF